MHGLRMLRSLRTAWDIADPLPYLKESDQGLSGRVSIAGFGLRFFVATFRPIEEALESGQELTRYTIRFMNNTQYLDSTVIASIKRSLRCLQAFIDLVERHPIEMLSYLQVKIGRFPRLPAEAGRQ